MNLHTHTDFCDGKGSPEDFVKKAISLGFKYLGFSAHAPLPFRCDWSLSAERLDVYCDEISHLKAHYQKKIRILHGFEIDYLEGMGFNENQYIVYKHFDVEHSHIHIVANRVNFSGDVVSDSNDYKRSETLIRKLEQKYNLSELIRKQESNVLSKGEIEKCLRTGDVPERLELQNILIEILNQNLLMKDFIDKLKLKGVNVKINQSLTTGFISGISFEYKGTFYKGSKIHKKFSWNNIKTKIITDEQNRNNPIIPEDNVGIRAAKTKTVGDEKLVSKIPRNHNRESSENIKQNRPTNEEIKNKPRFRFRR